MKNCVLPKVKLFSRQPLLTALLAAGLSLGVVRALATPELAYQFEKIDFQLVMLQPATQAAPSASTNIIISPLQTSAINNKYLLNYLATTLQTNWPAGAQLALENLRRDLFVVDKTGTNPLLNVSTGINVGGSNVVYFTCDSDEPVVSSKRVTRKQGNDSLIVSDANSYGLIFFHLFEEQNGNTNTDLYFEGLNISAVHSDLTITNSRYLVTDSSRVRGQMSVIGDGVFNGKWTVVDGEVSDSGNVELRGLVQQVNLPFPIITNLPPIIFTNRQPIIPPPPISSPIIIPPPPILIQP